MTIRSISQITKKLVFQTFAKGELATHIGGSIQNMERGQISIKFPKHPLVLQHHGYFHGGILSYLADISGGLAAFTTFQDPRQSSITIQLKINFLAAAKGEYIIGKGKVIQQTGSLIISTAQIYNDHNTLVAMMLQTNKKLGAKLQNKSKNHNNSHSEGKYKNQQNK